MSDKNYQNGYYNLKYYTGERNQQIEEEVRKSLFRVPNEEELENEFQEVERLQKLDEEFKQKKQELEKQRAKINISKLEKIEHEQKRLASRLEQIVNEPKENDQEEIYKLIALKRKIAESQKTEMKVLEDQFLLSKEKEIENRVRKKIELERVLEEKKKLNDKFSKVKMELDMIQNEEEDRIDNTKKYLEKALQREASNLLMNNAYKKGLERSGLQKGDDLLSEQDKILLSKALLDTEVQDQKEKELILKEIQARREQEKRKIQLEIQEKQRELNDQRFEIAEKQENLLKKKVQHYELQKRGNDFLASIQEGQGPPMEFILKNLQNVDEDQYRSESTIDDIVSRAKKFSKIGKSRIEFLKNDHKEFYGYDPYDKPYQGELKPLIQRMNPENVYISRMIIDLLIELTIRKHLENQTELAATREKQHYLQEKAKRIQKNLDTMTNSQIYVEMRDRIFKNVIDKIIREAAFEIATVNQMAKTISLNLIVRAIKGARNSGNSEEQLSKIFYSLRNQDMTKKKDDKFTFNYKDMEKIEEVLKKQKKDKQSKGKDAKKDKDKGKDQDEDKKDEEQEQKEDDQTVLQMYPEVECTETLGTEQILQIEMEYWNENVQLLEYPYLQHNIKKKYTVTAIALSFNKELLAIGYSNGLIEIYCTPPGDIMLIAKVEGQNQKKIVHLEFAFDNMSQLMVLDEDGNMSVNFNAYNLRSQIQKQQNSLDTTLNMRTYYDFDWRMLTRSGKVNNQDILKIVYCSFHPGITFTGLQPYIMMGCERGIIMKFNSNKDLNKGINYKFPIHNVINSQIITFNEAEFPNEHAKVLEIVDNHNEEHDKHINIFREFFVEHKAKIIQIVFLNKPETFISIDTRGYIFYWVYEKDQYLIKIDGYFPKSKYKVSCQVINYSLKNSNDKADGPNSVSINLNEGGQQEEKGKKYFKNLISQNQDYDKRCIYLKRNQSESLKDLADVIISSENLPQEPDQEVVFFRGRVDFNKQTFKSLFEEKYVSQLVDGYVSKCLAISGNKYIIIQQILPHKVDHDRVYVQFVRFDTNLFRLKKVKIILESPDVEDIDFSVVENFGPFGIPYLFVLMRQGLYVASLATGNILFDFKNHLTILQQEVKINQEVMVANNIKSILDMYIIITSNSSNGAYVFSIEDKNDDEAKRKVLTNQAEFKRLFVT
ncbi:hypothetical protein ABPG72_004824 [Tetrahymena utriculariae]